MPTKQSANQLIDPASYQAALLLVEHIERTLAWRPFYTVAGRSLTTLEEVVQAILNNQIDLATLGRLPHSRRSCPSMLPPLSEHLLQEEILELA